MTQSKEEKEEGEGKEEEEEEDDEEETKDANDRNLGLPGAGNTCRMCRRQELRRWSAAPFV